jgi:diguanylate cyclase (GGDEF)-like protein
VPNRRSVLDQLSAELERAERSGEPLSIALLDLDDFKRVNDTYGHAAGDTILQQTTERIRAVLRAHDSMGRYGGEEFLLVLPGCNEADAVDVADRVRVSIAGEPLSIGPLLLDMTASIGVATAMDGREPASELIHRADRALYRAKDAGRNCVAA